MTVEAMNKVVLPMGGAFKAQIAETQPFNFSYSRPGEGLEN